MSKTEEKICIPMTSALFTFLKQKSKYIENEFVCPELAEMYNRNPDGITYRFKKMLEKLGIETTKTFKGRSRQTSTKDIHSLRHTFCYLHGFQGTPLVTLQSIVGHLSKDMTAAYALHKTEQSKKDAIQRFALGSIIPDSLIQTKRTIIEMVNECQNEQSLKKIATAINEINKQNSLKF